MTESRYRANIVGAGIGGLAAGIALRQAGVEVTVFERARALTEVGAGISLWANAIQALRRLGLAELIHSFSVPDFPAAVRTWQGTPLTPPANSKLQQEFGDLCLVMHRADLHRALLEALGGDRVQLGKQCSGFSQDDHGVKLQFDDGTSVSGDLLIGADGLNSVVRARLHGPQKPTYAGYTAWRAVLPFNQNDLMTGESWGYGARFGQVPMPQGRVYWFAARTAPESQHSADGEKAELLRVFHGWHAPVEALIQATPEADILRNDIYDRPPLDWWGQGRVTLLGDAAHPMTPNLGQGACQALEDAVVLGQCLLKGDDISEALRGYEARRIPRTSWIVKRSRQIGRIAQWQSPLAVWVRNLLLKQAGPRRQANQLRAVIRNEL